MPSPIITASNDQPIEEQVRLSEIFSWLLEDWNVLSTGTDYESPSKYPHVLGTLWGMATGCGCLQCSNAEITDLLVISYKDHKKYQWFTQFVEFCNEYDILWEKSIGTFAFICPECKSIMGFGLVIEEDSELVGCFIRPTKDEWWLDKISKIPKFAFPAAFHFGKTAGEYFKRLYEN